MKVSIRSNTSEILTPPFQGRLRMTILNVPIEKLCSVSGTAQDGCDRREQKVLPAGQVLAVRKAKKRVSPFRKRRAEKRRALIDFFRMSS